MKLNRWIIGFIVGMGVACATAAIPVPAPVPQPPPPVNRAMLQISTRGAVAGYGSTQQFVTSDGVDFRWKGITDFSLFWRYLNNEDITPILTERAAIGANVLRVLGMVSWLDRFSPQERPDYFDKLGAFFDLAALHGLRVELVVFADAQIKMPNQADQLVQWDRVALVASSRTNVFLQVVNQGAKNGVESRNFPGHHAQFPNLLESRDSGMESANPPMPPLDYSAYTSTRSDVKWYVETGSSMYYVVYGWGTPEWGGTQQASVDDEPMGADEVDQPGRRSNDPARFKELARSITWGNGATFHCTDCIQSILLGPLQHASAVEFFANLP